MTEIKYYGEGNVLHDAAEEHGINSYTIIETPPEEDDYILGNIIYRGGLVYSEEKTPVLYAKKYRGGYVVWCKYCRRLHTHGKDDGHRIAHCAEQRFTGKRYVPTNSPYLKTGYIVVFNPQKYKEKIRLRV